MAIYHLHARAGTRSGGQSARAHVDYVLREGKYSAMATSPSADRVRHTESANMPGWVRAGREVEYWGAADQNERVNGVLFRSLEFALPAELSEAQQTTLTRDFVKKITTVDGGKLPASWAIHEGKGANPHVHLTMSERINDGVKRPPDKWFRRANKAAPEKGGATKNDIASHRKQWLETTRESWAKQANSALEKAGSKARIDSRSYADRSLDRVPGIHLGPARHRALREHKQGVPAAEIAQTDRTLQAAAKARSARKVEAEISRQQHTLLPFTTGAKPMNTSYPTPDDAEEAERKKQARWREQDDRKAEEKEAATGRRRAKEESAAREEIEAALGEAGGNPILAGGSGEAVERAGTRAAKNFELAGYISRKITTRKGYAAVAYFKSGQGGQQRPDLVDFGNSVSVYGAATQEEYRERAAALVSLGQKKGWASMNFWGGEKFLHEVIIESVKAGVQPNITANSAYQPSITQISGWFDEAKKEMEKEAAKAPAGGAESAKEKTPEGSSKAGEDTPYSHMSRKELVAAAQKLRRELGVESFEEDGQEMEGPSCG